MQRLEVSGAVRPIYGSLGVRRLRKKVMAVFRNFADAPKLIRHDDGPFSLLA